MVFLIPFTIPVQTTTVHPVTSFPLLMSFKLGLKRRRNPAGRVSQLTTLKPLVFFNLTVKSTEAVQLIRLGCNINRLSGFNVVETGIYPLDSPLLLPT
ncbi:hypothetical protein EAJ18_11965 [Citrobacter amalonaticus]|uniref:Uncharacterized protein n=1 Tax=Citrobacter amalonaticus TaxID=35703 RepID=A0ABY0HUY0_CITAM|nr:hypothetical protein EAJ18_11965 [Citrobacter amalonaticus]